MFCSRTSNKIINKLYERSLKNDYSSDFNVLFENNNDICNHHRNIQALLTEVFNVKNELAPPIMESVLNTRFNTYNLRNFQEFATERKRTVWYGLETLSYRYIQLCSLLPENLKEMNSLSEILSFGYSVTVLAGYVKFLFKILDFYDVKLYTFVKLGNLATISKKMLFF